MLLAWNIHASRNGREVTLGPGHFGLEHCCTAQATLTMPTVPEIWEVINEENWTSATSSPKAPKQLEMTDPVPATGEVEWGVEEYADPTLSMTPHKKKGCCLPGHRMDDQEMLEHLWWVLWCCCMGFGVSRQSAPLGVTFNCLCANSSCQTTPLRDQQGNCCGTFTELCCCSCICRGPPMPGDPRCVCCTVDLCGLVGSTAREGPTEGKKLGRLAAIDESFSQACIPCWCCCCGSRLAMPNNCIDTYIKFLWCEYFFHTGIPSVEAGLCPGSGGSLERSLIPESFIRKGPSCSQASAHPLCGTTRFAPVVAASGLRRVEVNVMLGQVRAAQQRGQREAAKRKEFLGGLINQDPSVAPAGTVGTLDCLYKAYDSASAPQAPPRRPTEGEKLQQAALEAEHAKKVEEAMQRRAEEDPLAGPPRSPRSGVQGATEDLPKEPIEVFEQKKRQKLRKKLDPTAEDPNSLLEWLEGQSLTSHSTATTASSQRTRFTDLSMTSLASSICSHPGTLVHESYRPHKRAYAVNINDWKPVNQHEAGVSDHAPQEQFGTASAGVRNISKKMYEKVLRPEQHAFISRFLSEAPVEQREQFTGLVRSLEYLRLQKHREDTSTSNLHMDLHENARLWRPPKQKPMFDRSEINISRVPLGTMVQQKVITTEAPLEPPGPPRDLPPPSPSVSGLGSLPLTRVATPLATRQLPTPEIDAHNDANSACWL
eukprot:g19787.t1